MYLVTIKHACTVLFCKVKCWRGNLERPQNTVKVKRNVNFYVHGCHSRYTRLNYSLFSLYYSSSFTLMRYIVVSRGFSLRQAFRAKY